MTGNNAPKIKWVSEMLACETRRQRLFVDGRETPFFIDSANGILAHRTTGYEHGLFGAGMGPIAGNRSGLRIAAILGAGPRIAELKHRAEQMALASA